ncbi:peptidylprolyl isomerase [Rhodovibrio sodomensis]|uniref:peptidylprolyl isomerase n=1 Tax=Rhodovibrio sodomensis TaxID=1088 RepID=UPI0019066AA7|nr:peptidylprolyl isomerase [Rhodovibrio sodomensis]
MNNWIKTALVAGVLALSAPPAQAQDGNPVVRLETNRGDIRIELFAERAPQSVENFLAYVRTDHYDGTIFHRVIPDFMIQGGGFTPDYTRKPTRDPIRNEADNGLSNDRGTVAMARTGQPHSATAQFFINLSDNEFLDHTAKTQRGWGYAVFGEVISGLGTVDEIGQVPTGSAGPFAKDAPQQPVVIQDVVVE